MSLQNAIMCLALNIYHEARGEPVDGQIAVAMVTMNRAQWETHEVCPVVYAPRQFSWTGSKKVSPQKEPLAWARAQKIARKVLAGEHRDKTQGATHFHSREVRPVWRHSLKRTAHIGKHVFYVQR